MTYEDMRHCVEVSQSAQWSCELLTIGVFRPWPREFCVGAPSIVFKMTGVTITLRPDLPRLPVQS